MTDSFLHPDGNHYRFLGFGPEAMKGDGPFYIESWMHGDRGEQLPAMKQVDQILHPVAIFERVEPPMGIQIYHSGMVKVLGTDDKMHYIHPSSIEPRMVSDDGRLIVEPPLWPWTGPSGRVYDYSDGDLWWDDDIEEISSEDFAGLSERLQKQAELNQ